MAMASLRIGVDNISCGDATGRQGPGGMREYVSQMILGFHARRPDYKIIVFTPAWADPLVESTDGIHAIVLRGVPRSKLLRAAYQQTVLPWVAGLQELDVFFATSTVAPLAIRAPVVLAVQFLQFYEQPEGYGFLRRRYLRALLPLSVRKAKRTITFTNAAARDLVRHVGMDETRLRIVAHGLSDALRTASRQHHGDEGAAFRQLITGGRPYIVYVSATYGYKNHLTLIRAFAEAKRLASLPHVLVLVGSEVTVAFDDLRRQAAAVGIRDSLVITGRVEDPGVYYRHADLAVMPSLYETFGFTALEPMLFECPVVASCFGSVAELAGDSALLVDPRNTHDLATGIVRVLGDPILRQQLISRGVARAEGYTWCRCAAETLAVIEDAAKTKQIR